MGAFKLGKMTFGSLFKKPETVLYPIETKPKPEGLKGHIVIDVDNCILCGMCDRSCATNCIKVDKQARTWLIDRLQCVQCGYCITVCPKKCLAMSPDYAPATTEHKPDVFEVSDQAAPAPKPAAEPTPEKAAEPIVEETVKSIEDAQLETLIGLMDADKAERVRSALSR